MTKFEFKKMALLPIIMKYGFDDIDEVAFVKVINIIEIMVFNLLNNVLYVVKALNVKTITKKHCLAVLQIMKDYETGKEIEMKKGGGLVMPSEYYGIDSGRYFDADVVAALENQPWADPGLTRTSLESSFGGGKRGSKKVENDSFVSKVQVKSIIAKYKESENESFKVASVVYDIIISCIMSNLDALFTVVQEQSKGRKKMTMSLLYSALKKNPKKFAHMSYILSNNV
jgi:hypothetical protein